MPSVLQNFSIPAGDDATIRITLQGTDVELLEASIYWRVFGMPNGVPDMTQVLIEKVVGGGIANIDYEYPSFDIILERDDTLNLLRNYYHEAKVVDIANGVKHTTVTTGIMTVTPTRVREDES